jgi:hypothetical protein
LRVTTQDFVDFRGFSWFFAFFQIDARRLEWQVREIGKK